MPARARARAGLYVHVPFCATRCTYCDFATGTLTRARLERYVSAIEREMSLRAAAARGVTFSSVFFGGGTPSVLPSRVFTRIWDVLRSNFDVAADAEITLEANPESVRDALLDTWVACGVNRLSMGVQSFDDAALRRLGRIHDARRPGEAFARARAHGFRRLSLDLMFGFPGDDAATWERTLDTALALEPEHLSAYCFIPEAGTPLGHAVLEGRVPLPSPEAQAERYDRLHARLEAAGFAAYETSNFCRPGGEARHNLVYWLRRPCVALGPSGHGFLDDARYGNRRDVLAWADAVTRNDGIEAEREDADAATVAEEIVMLGLRLSSGLWPVDYDAATWQRVERRFGGAFDRAVASGRLIRDARGVRIPRALRFVADDVIAWIAAESERAPRGAHLTRQLAHS